MRYLYCAGLVASSFIVVRHDRDDAEYLKLAEPHTAVMKIGQAGDGTLIAPDWLLTAAHVAHGMNPDRATVRVGDRVYRIKQRVWHPEWRELGPHDIGLVQLDAPVDGVRPLPLYARRDEAGRIALLVGHGDTRASGGQGGEWRRDGVRRAATNRIDSANAGRLVFTFDRPPRATRLEGAPGRGDSGGPALIQRNGRYHIVGVSSAGFDGENGPGTYGAVDHYTRVSDYRAWIDSVTSNLPRGTQR